MIDLTLVRSRREDMIKAVIDWENGQHGMDSVETAAAMALS